MSEAPVPAFHVMAKPTGARCNLRCDYCFFLEKEDLYPGSDFRMRDEGRRRRTSPRRPRRSACRS